MFSVPGRLVCSSFLFLLFFFFALLSANRWMQSATECRSFGDFFRYD